VKINLCELIVPKYKIAISKDIIRWMRKMYYDLRPWGPLNEGRFKVLELKPLEMSLEVSLLLYPLKNG